MNRSTAEIVDFILARTPSWKQHGGGTMNGKKYVYIKYQAKLIVDKDFGNFRIFEDDDWQNIDKDGNVMGCGHGLLQLREYCLTSNWVPIMNAHHKRMGDPRYQ